MAPSATASLPCMRIGVAGMSVIPPAVDAALAARHGPLVIVRTRGECRPHALAFGLGDLLRRRGLLAARAAALRWRSPGQCNSQSRQDTQSSARATTGYPSLSRSYTLFGAQTRCRCRRPCRDRGPARPGRRCLRPASAFPAWCSSFSSVSFTAAVGSVAGAPLDSTPGAAGAEPSRAAVRQARQSPLRAAVLTGAAGGSRESVSTDAVGPGTAGACLHGLRPGPAWSGA